MSRPRMLPMSLKPLPTVHRPRPPEMGRLRRKPKRLSPPIPEFTNTFELPRIHYKPTDATDMFIENSLAMTANESYTTVSTFTLPKGYEGVIKGIVATSTDTTVPSVTLWQLLINSQPVPGWYNAFNRGSYWDANHSFNPVPVTILVPTGSIITLQVQNTGAATPTAMGAIIGWYWIQKEIRYASME